MRTTAKRARSDDRVAFGRSSSGLCFYLRVLRGMVGSLSSSVPLGVLERLVNIIGRKVLLRFVLMTLLEELSKILEGDLVFALLHGRERSVFSFSSSAGPVTQMAECIQRTQSTSITQGPSVKDEAAVKLGS